MSAPVVRFGRSLCLICGEREVSVPVTTPTQLCDDCKSRPIDPEPKTEWRRRRMEERADRIDYPDPERR